MQTRKQLPASNKVTPIATGYTPPSNPEAEQSVLGAVLVRPEAFDVVATLITPTDFYRQAHADIYQAMLDLREAEKPVDLVTVSALLKERGKIEGIGGSAFVAGLSAECGYSTNAEYYAGLVRDKARLRRLLDTTQEIAAACFAPVENVSEFLSESAQKVKEVSETAGDQAAVTLETMVDRQSTVVEAQFYAKEPSGLPVGYLDLARLISWEPGDLIILAARPSMGKSLRMSAMILMADGTWKAMSEMEVGAPVASIDGQPSLIEGVYPQGERPIYALELSDGRIVEADPEHLWVLESCRWKGQRKLTTLELGELISRSRFKNRVRMAQHAGEFGTVTDLGVDPWLLGFLLGDGSLKSSGCQFSNPEPYILERIARITGMELRSSCNSQKDWRIFNGHGVPHPIREALKNLKVIGLSAHEKYIPEVVFQAVRSVREGVLAGLLESDGWIEKFGSVQFSSSSEALTAGVARLVHSLSGYASSHPRLSTPKYSYQGELREGRPSFIASMSLENMDRILQSPRLLKNFKRSRPASPVIKSVNYVGTDTAQCIKVSHPSGLFIMDGYVVTHNTALALNFMLRVATPGAHAGIFTLETSKEKLTRRFMSIIGRINGHRMNQGNLAPQEWVQFSRLRDQVEGMPIWIDDADLNIAEMRARARRQRKAGQLDFLVVDYLQLVKPMKRGRSREEDVAELSRGLKKLAKELEIPVLAVSALNRKFADRPNKRPMRSDLRESGAIEFDADKILFLYREEVDKPNLADVQGIAEVDVDKHKDGPTGRVKLAFQKEFFRFEDLCHG